MITRRQFFKAGGSAAAACVMSASDAAALESKAGQDDAGCLVDLTRCIGCRMCEQACNQSNDLPPPSTPFTDQSLFDRIRRPGPAALTVVNRYFSQENDDQGNPVPTYVKLQCMHCQDPACVSACMTGAMHKAANGAVVYDPGKCLGCRYCMVACPFEMPAYEYDRPLMARVMKCQFCFERVTENGKLPACASVCPVEAIAFGPRQELIQEAETRIGNDPDRYIRQIFGQYEAGGTNWMYISGVPFSKLGFPDVPERPLPKLTESIQHGLFQYLWSPIVLFGVLGGIMYMNREKKSEQAKEPSRHKKEEL